MILRLLAVTLPRAKPATKDLHVHMAMMNQKLEFSHVWLICSSSAPKKSTKKLQRNQGTNESDPRASMLGCLGQEAECSRSSRGEWQIEIQRFDENRCPSFHCYERRLSIVYSPSCQVLPIFTMCCVRPELNVPHVQIRLQLY